MVKEEKDAAYKFVDNPEVKTPPPETIGQAITRLLQNLTYLEQTTGRDTSKAIQELGKLQQSLTEGQLNAPLKEVEEEKET